MADLPVTQDRVTVAGHFIVKPGALERLLAIWTELIEHVKAHEPRTELYQLQQDVADPAKLWLHEIYQDEAAFTAHGHSPVVREFANRMAPLIAERHLARTRNVAGMRRPPLGVAASHPLGTLDWPVHTERLLLRRAAGDDVDATWAFRRLPEVQEWLGAATSTYQAYRERYLREERLADQVIVERDGQVIGELMLKIQDGWAQDEVAEWAQGGQGELGWTFDPAFGGQGYATEAVRALIDLCFGPLGLRRIHAGCFFDNQRSWRLMERLGMRREQHTVKDSLHSTRGWLDGLSYALLADEWTATSGRQSPR